MYIFLDIDGVLVKEDIPGEEFDLEADLMTFDETCLTLFETIICKYEHSKIIISSSWIEIYPIETIKSLFSPNVAKKIIGATPRLSYPIKYFRHQEVLNYLKQQGLEDEPWIAIDDIAEHYPADISIVVTNPYKGFDKIAANKLEFFLSTSQNITNSTPEVSEMRNEFSKQQKFGESKIPSLFPKTPENPKSSLSEKSSLSSKNGQFPTIESNHEELIRDYAGYDSIQEEMDRIIERFIELYYEDILESCGYNDSSKIERLEVNAAGAGASKFVFGVFGKTANGEIPLIFGIRMYNNIGKMKDEEKIYDCFKEYQLTLETYDKKLVDVLIDELRIYQEFKEKAKTSIDIRSIRTRFSLHNTSLIGNEDSYFVDQFVYIEDCELKRLMVNLGINAITVGDFIVGYDGKKILERDEFSVTDKIYAIVQISNTLLQTWLLTLRYNDKQQLVGRTIVDLKPAQFVVQSHDMRREELMPAVIIDVGPAENTDNIYTYFKTMSSINNMIPAFATEMLKKIGLSPNEHQDAKHTIYDGMIIYLNDWLENELNQKNISPAEFLNVVNEFKKKLQVF